MNWKEFPKSLLITLAVFHYIASSYCTMYYGAVQLIKISKVSTKYSVFTLVLLACCLFLIFYNFFFLLALLLWNGTTTCSFTIALSLTFTTYNTEKQIIIETETLLYSKKERIIEI